MGGRSLFPFLQVIAFAIMAMISGATFAAPVTGEAETKNRVVARGTLELRTEGGTPMVIQIRGVRHDDAFRFAGSKRIDGADCTIEYDWVADLDPRGGARLSGIASIINHAPLKREFDLRVRLPLDPLVTEGSRIGGTVRVTLVMGDDGGRVDLPAGESLWAAMIDGQPAKTLHRGPFAMGGRAKGTSSADASFGAPYPSCESPAVTDDFGIRHRFRLSGGDEIRFQSDLQLAGDPANFVRRRSAGPVRIGERDSRVIIDLGASSRQRDARGSGVTRSRGSKRSSSREPVRINPGARP